MLRNKEQQKGFTIIEVSLFLALTGILVVTLVASISSNISSKRYNDSVQNFTEYLRNTYSDATYTQNSNTDGGKDSLAIYGKLLVFSDNSGLTAKSYTVVGSASPDLSSTSRRDAKQAFKESNFAIQRETEQTYNTQWQARIQETTKGKSLIGSLLIARSPADGAIHTYFSNNDFSSGTSLENWLDGAATPADTEVNFCIDSDDLRGQRRNVRIDTDAHNASAIELIATDSGDNACAK